jgi:hypothetical protein
MPYLAFKAPVNKLRENAACHTKFYDNKLIFKLKLNGSKYLNRQN